MSIEWTPQAHKVSTARPYKGPIVQLTDEDLRFFEREYEIKSSVADEFIKSDGKSRYILPIYRPRNPIVRGWVLRRPWPGAPLKADPSLPKADTYKEHPDDPLLSWHEGLLDSDRPHVLVEDQLSAIKLCSMGLNAVACLGKPVSTTSDCSPSAYARVRELSHYAPRLIVALDADATAEAFQFVKRWGAAFREARVMILERDIKDMARGDIAELFYSAP